MLRTQGGEEHEKYKELCALAACGSLAPLELSELQLHLERCGPCRDIYSQFRSLTTQGMMVLADAPLEGQDQAYWPSNALRRRKIKRLRLFSIPLHFESVCVLSRSSRLLLAYCWRWA
jgi:hypothetical protein